MKRINIQTNLPRLTLEEIEKVSKFDLSKEFTLHTKDEDKELSRNFKPGEAQNDDYIYVESAAFLSQNNTSFHLVSQ